MINLSQHILWFTFLFFISGCKENIDEPNITLSENETQVVIKQFENSTTTKKNDSIPVNSLNSEPQLLQAPKLEKFFHPNMSFCGGNLYGYYDSGELVKIESRFGAEFGYSIRNIEFKNGEVIKIFYQEYFADYEKFSQNYPNSEFIDREKLTYTDTSYIIEFGAKNSFKKYGGTVFVSNQNNEDLIKKLLDCVETMKFELDSEKVRVK